MDEFFDDNLNEDTILQRIVDFKLGLLETLRVVIETRFDKVFLGSINQLPDSLKEKILNIKKVFVHNLVNLLEGQLDDYLTSKELRLKVKQVKDKSNQAKDLEEAFIVAKSITPLRRKYLKQLQKVNDELDQTLVKEGKTIDQIDLEINIKKPF